VVGQREYPQPSWWQNDYWEGSNSPGAKIMQKAIEFFPPTAMVVSGNKIATGKDLSGKQVSGLDKALGLLDFIPEGGTITKAAAHAAIPIAIIRLRQAGEQVHHIIPKAVHRNVADAFSGIANFRIDQISNLRILSTTIHGWHPQYNTYVRNLVNNAAALNPNGRLTPEDVSGIITHLDGLIDEAVAGGQRLNEYFRDLLPPNSLR
jgi:hypothetical protein